MALPTWRLVAVTGCVCGAVAVGTLAWSGPVLRGGLLGAGVVFVVAVIGLLILSPWKEREVSTWMSFWIGLTGFRMLVTPALAWVLYSATSDALDPKSCALAVGLAYMATVIAEAAVVSRHLSRHAGTAAP